MTREALARALTGTVGLGESPSHDAAPVDRLHAVGAAQRASQLAVLGFELVRLKNSNVAEAYGPCKDGLADFLMERCDNLNIKRPQAEIIAAQVVMEFVIDYCHACGGRGETPDTSRSDGRDGAVPMKACGVCGGVGVRRYTDDERAQAIGDARKLQRAFSEAHAILAGAVREALWNYRRLFRA